MLYPISMIARYVPVTGIGGFRMEWKSLTCWWACCRCWPYLCLCMLCFDMVMLITSNDTCSYNLELVPYPLPVPGLQDSVPTARRLRRPRLAVPTSTYVSGLRQSILWVSRHGFGILRRYSRLGA